MSSTNLRSAVLFLFLIFLIGISGCSKKAMFQPSQETPAARGYIKLRSDHNHNYIVKVEINNLAEVERLRPMRKVYVIWMESGRDMVRNIGQLKSSSGKLMFRRLNASFRTVSAERPTKIFITAEDESGLRFPNAPIIMTTRSF